MAISRTQAQTIQTNMDMQQALQSMGNVTIPNTSNYTTGVTMGRTDIDSTVIGTVPSYETHAIRGKLLKVEMISDMVHLEDAADPKLYEENIKLQLCQKMAEELYASGMIQWMKQPSDHSNSYMNYRAYAYIVPSEDVQVIRTLIK